MKDLFFFAVLSVMPVVDQTASVEPLVPPAVEQVEPMVALIVPTKPEPPAVLAPEIATPARHCRVGKLVMIPDGREGQVTSYVDGVCRVLAYGEAYVSLWQDEMVELVYPQLPERFQFGH
jgi:uncharacterized protein YqgV (UPF0045/DUF77 family)